MTGWGIDIITVVVVGAVVVAALLFVCAIKGMTQ